MNQEEIITVIRNTVKNRRKEVLKSLIDSDVILPEINSDEDLVNIIVGEVRKGNGYLIYNLGEVITKEIDPKNEKKSNIAPLVGAALISTGGGFLSGLFGGGGKDKAQQQAQQQAQAAADARAAQEAAIRKQMIIAASQQKAQEIMANTDIENRKASTSRTLLAIGLISGALLVGTVVAVLILKKK